MTWSGKDLKQLAPAQRQSQLPDFLRILIQQAAELLQPEKIWLFGSRARGDARENSDYDLAFELEPSTQARWSQFCAQVEENPPSLHHFDLVNYSQAGDDLKKQISIEGIILYDKKK